MYQKKRKIRSESKKGEKSERYGVPCTEKEKAHLSKTLGRKVIQKTLSGKLIKEYDSVYEAAKAVGVKTSEIKRVAYKFAVPKTFIWELVGDMKVSGEKSPKIAQFSTDGQFLRIFPSSFEAASFVNATRGTILWACNIKNNRPIFKFYWRFCEDDSVPENLKTEDINCPRKINKNTKKVKQVDSEGNIVGIYDSPRDAAEKTNLRYTPLRKACNESRYNRYSGFRWYYI